MWIYLMLLGVFVYALYKERQALGCPTIPDGTDCDNRNGKAIRGTRPHPSDPTTQIYDKIVKAADFADRWVMWRIAYIMAVPCILFFFFCAYRTLPKEHELFVGVFVVSAIMYFTLNFYKFHLINYAKDNIEDGVKILRSRSL